MNREQRRKNKKYINTKTKRYTGEEIMSLRTKAVRSTYADFMSLLLMSFGDEFDYQDRSDCHEMMSIMECCIRKRINDMEDVADFDNLMTLLKEVEVKMGLTIVPGDMERDFLNRKNMVGKTYFYTSDAIEHMIHGTMGSAFSIYFAVFILHIYRMTGYTSSEEGNSPLDKLVHRIWDNMDSLHDKYAQVEFTDVKIALEDELKFVVPSLD